MQLPFTKPYIDAAPDRQGVYLLYDQAELIYIGRAAGSTVTIRSRLQSHYNGFEGRCTQAASHFDCDVTSTPTLDEAQLLEEYRLRFGRLPRCNERAA
jgi:excinuclease UvrABC nuclease subunit